MAYPQQPLGPMSAQPMPGAQPMPQIGGMGGAPMPNYPARDGIAAAMMSQQNPQPGFVGGPPPLPSLPQMPTRLGVGSGLSPPPAAQGPSVAGTPTPGLGMVPQPGQLPTGMGPLQALGQIGQPKMPSIG